MQYLARCFIAIMVLMATCDFVHAETGTYDLDVRLCNNDGIYYVEIEIDDANEELNQISVTGDGITGSLSLYYDANEGYWVSYDANEDEQITFDSVPAPPLSYSFNITKKDTSVVTQSASVASVVADVPQIVSPAPESTNNALGDITWTMAQGSYLYTIDIYNSNGDKIWRDRDLTDKTYHYQGPKLLDGNYKLRVRAFDSNGNYSRIKKGFAISGSNVKEYTAEANYTFVGDTLSISYNASDFECEGPVTGQSETFTVENLDNYSMTWRGSDDQTMTWHRNGGTPGDIRGTWTMVDDGDGFTVIFSDTTVSLRGTVYGCGLLDIYSVSVNSGGQYYVDIEVLDENEVYESVRVEGFGISGSIDLIYYQGDRAWCSYDQAGNDMITLGEIPPPVPQFYQVIVKRKNIADPVMQPFVIESFVENIPVVTSPAPGSTMDALGNISWEFEELNFSFTYDLAVYDVSGNKVWRADAIQGKSTTYTGPKLPGGNYTLKIKARDENGNYSKVKIPFTIGGPGAENYTANGTYTYSNSQLAMTYTYSNFGCEGPVDGETDNFTVTSITATEMVWTNSEQETYNWHRDNGQAGNILGTWTWSEDANTFEFTFSEGGVVSVEGSVVGCEKTQAFARSSKYNGIYNMDMYVPDEGHLFSSISVKGPGINGSVNLRYSVEDGNWYSENSDGDALIPVSAPLPPLPLVYAMNITKKSGGSIVQPVTIVSVVEEVPVLTSPVENGSLFSLGTISWNFNDEGKEFKSNINLYDEGGKKIWQAFDIKDKFIEYNGPRLNAGNYKLKLRVRDGRDNESVVKIPFTIKPPVAEEHSASGTYTYDSAEKKLVLTFTESDFVCEGPEKDLVETLSVVTISAKELVWEEPDGYRMTWTRGSGTEGEITGTWNTTNGLNSHTLSLNGGQLTVSGQIAECDDDGERMVFAGSANRDGQYEVQMFLRDTDQEVFASVEVRGPGIDGSIFLHHETENNWWTSWSPNGVIGPVFGQVHPEAPLTYTFYVRTENGTVTTRTETVTGFIETLPEVNYPAAGQTVAGVTEFSWVKAQEMGSYRVELWKDDGTINWYQSDIYGSSVTYNGQVPLTDGNYHYNLIFSDEEGNMSSREVAFTIAGGPVKGDLDGDFRITLADVVLALKAAAGVGPQNLDTSGDVNSDGKIGMAEAVYLVKKVALGN